MNDSAVILEDVSKSFRISQVKNQAIFNYIFSLNKGRKDDEELCVLDSISLDVKKGEIIGIMGRNGSGKTTLLKLVAGILKPDSGKIITNGEITPFLEIGTGFNPELTASENIIIYGVIMGFSKKSIESKVQNVLKFAELEKFANTPLKHFSSGMYARLAFASAVQVDPDIMLVDEVLAVGDISFKKKSFETFSTFKNKKKTIILVSQDIKSIKDLCDRVIILENGKIVFNGKPDVGTEFYQNMMENK